MGTYNIDEVVCRKLQYDVQALNLFVASRLVAAATLRSSYIDDLREISASAREECDEAMADIYKLREPRCEADIKADTVCEYDFEPDMRATAISAIGAWQADVDDDWSRIAHLAGEGEYDMAMAGSESGSSGSSSSSEWGGTASRPRAEAKRKSKTQAQPQPSSSAASSSDMHAPVPAAVPAVLPGEDTFDFAQYDEYIYRKNLKYPQVKAPGGQILGELQAMGGVMTKFKATAVCFCKHHAGRCNRMRAWRDKTGEAPVNVYRVLAHWLFRQHRFVSTQAHMDDARH